MCGFCRSGAHTRYVVMVNRLRIILYVLVSLLPFQVQAGIQANAQVKLTSHDNFNLASDKSQAQSETVNTVQTSLTWFKGSSKDFVWLVNGYYSFNKYEINTHLTGSSVSVLGGMFYRMSPNNSLTLKLGKRARKYDDEDLRLYQADAHFATLQLSHRLSHSTLVNERFKYESNETTNSDNKYTSATAQLWFNWKLSKSGRLHMGYVRTDREYENSGSEYVFEEPYASLSYNLPGNMYVRLGYSKLKMSYGIENRAYNSTASLSLGVGF